MRKLLQITSILATLIFNAAFASLDPVSWSLSPTTGFPPTPVGHQSIVTYTLTNNLPNPTTLITEFRNKGGAFNIANGCNNITLKGGERCGITIGFNPTKSGDSSIQLTYGYDNNRIPLPTLIARATGQGDEQVTGIISGLPTTFTLSNPEQKPKFTVTYTNTGTTDVTGYAGDTGGTNLLTTDPTSVATVLVLGGSNTCGTNGSPVTLRKGESCSLMGQLTPVSVGTVTVTGLFTYEGDTKTSTPKAQSQVINGGGGCIVHGQTTLPLPSNTYKYADNVVQFTFENECSTGSATLGPVTISSDSTPTAVITTNTTYDLCSNKTLPAQGSCTVIASVIPQSVGNLTVTATVTSDGHQASAKTHTVADTNIQNKHHILFVNQCPFNVWYGIQNGDGVKVDKPCVDGGQPAKNCKKTPDPNIAIYGATPPESAYFLKAQAKNIAPSTIDLPLTKYINGKLWPRTGCKFDAGKLNCAIGTCNTLPNSGTCVNTDNPILPNPQNPTTLFEAFISDEAGKDGDYDVSIINGMTVPVEYKAFGPSTGNTAKTVYNCAGAGAILQPQSNNALGNCSWNFNPADNLSGITNVNNDFYWVTPGADDGCTNATGCGMAYSTSPNPANPGGAPINRRTGDFLAYSTLANNVGLTATGQWGSVNLYSKYSMGVEIAHQNSTHNYGTKFKNGNTYNSYKVLLACTPDDTATSGSSANSCYQKLDGAQFAQCCGCIDWSETLPSFACGSNGTGYITYDNRDWTTNTIPMTDGAKPVPTPIPSTYTVLNAVRWLKTGCPTAYSYQFDDPSSSFKCTNDGDTKMLTSYQVTFCPGGLTGLPAGLTDGRPNPP